MGVPIGHRVIRTFKEIQFKCIGSPKGKCAMWMVCVRFVDETAIINNESIEIVIENIWLYFHRTRKHSSSDIKEFWRDVFVKNVLISVEADTDFLCFRCHGWVVDYATAWMDSWWVTQQILYDFRNRFLNLAHAIRYLHALIQEYLYICNYNVMSALLRWYLTESHHKCRRMCLWRDVDMQRIIDKPEIVVTDYLRRCYRLLTNG